MTCSRWSDGDCSLPQYQRPSAGWCMSMCPDYDGPARGAGDVIASITKTLGIKPCGKCQQRRAALNRAVPRRA